MAEEHTIADHQAALQRATAAGNERAAAVIRADLNRALEAEGSKMAAEGMGTGERVLANVGAGFHKLGQGVSQLLGGKVTDEDVRETRRRDEALAKATETGLGPSWLPSVGTATQFAAEVAPTLFIPGAGAAGSLAAKALPRVAQAAKAIGAGAAGGAAAGALAPVTEDESRGLNVALGAAGGAALPGAVAAWRAGRSALGRTTQAGGVQRAAGHIVEELGGDQAAADVAQAAERRAQSRRFQPESVREIPETLSEATGSPRASILESRSRRGPAQDEWAEFIGEQNRARYNAVQDATREAPHAAARDIAREASTTPLRERALKEAAKDQWFNAPVVQHLDDLMAGEAGVSPATRKVVNYVRSTMGEQADSAITPERLYRVRKELAKLLQGPAVIADELSAAVKSSQRETLGIMHSIDAALDAASGGKWTPYMERFERRSRGVNAAEAAQRARAVFDDPTIQTVGGEAQVTLPRVRAAMREGASTFDPRESALSPRGQRILDQLAQQQTRAAEPGVTRKLVGTQGGGSQTSTDLGEQLIDLSRRVPFVSQAVEGLTAKSNEAMQREVARLLMNPQQAVASIRAAQAAGQPLSAAQQNVLQVLSRGATSALPLSVAAARE